MKEKDVAFFSALLNEDAETVQKYAEEGTLSDQLGEFVPKEQVDKLKVNLSKEVRESHLNELTEQAKKGELDGDLYKAIKGASYQMLEKDLSKEYGVEDYDNVRDLISKAITNNTTKTDDAKLKEYEDKITRLQEANTKLVSEKDEAVKQARNEYESKILSREKSDYVSKIPFDFSDVEDTELDKTKESRQKIVADVFDARYSMEFKDDQIVVKDKDGNALMNEATYDPIPPSDVMRKIAYELGIKLKSPESGGQGGQSSGKKSSRFKDVDEFEKYCQDKGIVPTSAEGLTLLRESGLKLT